MTIYSLNTRLSCLPWHLTFWVHPYIGASFYWCIFFWYLHNVTISHPYSVLVALLPSVQIQSFVFMTVWYVIYVGVNPKYLLLVNERTSLQCSLFSVLVDYLKCSHGYLTVSINSDNQNWIHLLFLLILMTLWLFSNDRSLGVCLFQITTLSSPSSSPQCTCYYLVLLILVSKYVSYLHFYYWLF